MPTKSFHRTDRVSAQLRRELRERNFMKIV